MCRRRGFSGVNPAAIIAAPRAWKRRGSRSQRRQEGKPGMTALDSREAQDLADILARVALRDQAAFKLLYDRTVRVLLAIVVRLLRDQAWAEEVLQEVYV